jgi:hypothetical protein
MRGFRQETTGIRAAPAVVASMKTIRWIFLTFALGLAAAGLQGDPAGAAAAAAPSPRPAFRQILQARLLQSLQLTPEQRVQARAIRQRTAAALAAIRADATLSADDKLLRSAERRRAGEREFRELLSDAQREKLFRLQRQARRLLRMLRN